MIIFDININRLKLLCVFWGLGGLLCYIRGSRGWIPECFLVFYEQLSKIPFHEIFSSSTDFLLTKHFNLIFSPLCLKFFALACKSAQGVLRFFKDRYASSCVVMCPVGKPTCTVSKHLWEIALYKWYKNPLCSFLWHFLHSHII